MFKLARNLSLRNLQWTRDYFTRVESKWSRVLKDSAPTRELPKLPHSKYGGESTVTLLTGDNIVGQQGAAYIKTLFESAKVPVVFERIPIDSTADDSRLEFVTSVMRNRAAIQVDLHYHPDEKRKSLLLNSELDLFASVVRMRSMMEFRGKYPDVDITLFMQNNSGDFTKMEYEPVRGIVETLRICQAKDIHRYLKYVFEYAVRNCHKKITIGHKSRWLPLSDGLFVQQAQQMHADHYKNDFELELMSIDIVVNYLVAKPQHFDLICSNDRYGTLLASICSSVCGGASLFSVSEFGDHHAVFKPLQTKLSLSDVLELSPYGIVRACIDLVRHLGYDQCANLMDEELHRTMCEKNVKTAEYGGTDTDAYVICNIVNRLKCRFGND